MATHFRNLIRGLTLPKKDELVDNSNCQLAPRPNFHWSTTKKQLYTLHTSQLNFVKKKMNILPIYWLIFDWKTLKQLFQNLYDKVLIRNLLIRFTSLPKMIETLSNLIYEILVWILWIWQDLYYCNVIWTLVRKDTELTKSLCSRTKLEMISRHATNIFFVCLLKFALKFSNIISRGLFEIDYRPKWWIGLVNLI